MRRSRSPGQCRLRAGVKRGFSGVLLHHGLVWICFAPFIVATLGVISFIGLGVIRWINEGDDSRTTRALWAVLWTCGLAMLALGATLGSAAM
jgi:hypothetical protein